MSGTRAVRVVIRGRVQGVGFRAWTADEAQALSLAGWVRNRPDDTVEALFSGSPDAVGLMLQACRTGPRAARVDTVEECDPGPGELAGLSGFAVR